MKKIKFGFLIFIFLIGFGFWGLPKTNNIVHADVIDDIFDTNSAVGTYVNNLVLLNFKNETNTLEQNVPNNQIALYDEVYNVNSHSLNAFYSQLSNGNLNLETEFIENSDNIEVITIDKEREYFMNYCFYNNDTKTWQINTDGYFAYELVESSSTPASGGLDLGFLLNSTHKYFVYGDSSYSSNKIPSDKDISDGIISYDYAEQLVNSNSNYHLIESAERYFRELELISLISNELDNKIDLTNCDNNQDGEIDILNFNILDNPNKNYRIEWSELLWAHQFSLGSILDMELSYGSIYSGTLYNFIQNQLYSSVLKDFLQPHIYGDIDTYIDCAKNRPSVTTGLTTKNVDRYYLTTFNAQNLYGLDVDDFENIKDALQLSTTAHELGHVFGLPDLYEYPSNDGDSVKRWSLMCYNSNPSQYMTAFERELLGWLDSDNIKTIDSSGTYILNATIGYDENNVVAYKIQNKKDLNQWIYFEYRNKEIAENSYWEQNTGEAGLLVYRVDTSILTGNMYAPPYGVWVYRDDTIENATFVENDEFGNFDIKVLQNALTWQNGANNFVNSGYKFVVENQKDYTLMFEFFTEQSNTTVDLNGEAQQTLYVGDVYSELGITIKENGNIVNYSFDNNLSKNRTFKIEYFVGTNVETFVVCDYEKTYTILYSVKDSAGITHRLYRTVYVLEKEIDVQLSGSEIINIETEGIYNELYITILENGVDVTDNYILVSDKNSLIKNSYCVTYYKTDDKYQTYYEIVQSISTATVSNYIAEYKVMDNNGTTHTLIRKICVVGKKVVITNLNKNIETKLKQILQEDILYEDSLINLRTIDLSGIELNDILGLNQFQFNENTIINLTNNNLTSYDEINKLLNDAGNVKILLSGNNYNLNYAGMITKLNNVVLGLQNDGEYEFLINEDYIEINLNIYNDYNNYYNLYVNGQLVDYNYKITNYGTYQIKMEPKDHSIATEINISKKICIINQIQNDLSYRYNDEHILNFDVLDYIELYGINQSDLYITDNFNELDLSTLNEQTFNISISHNLIPITTFNYNITLFDDIAPNLNLKPNNLIYFLAKDSYVNQTFEDYCTITDEFDQNATLKIQKPDFNGYGRYEIVFIGTDSSDNHTQQILNVYVGDVYLEDISQFEYNINQELPLIFEYYTINDFNIKYKLKSETNFTTYQEGDTVLFSNYGDETLTIQLILVNDSTVVKNITKSIKVLDTILPNVKLNGESTEYVAVGASFMDKGITISDNTPNNELQKQTKYTLNGQVVEFIDTSFENEYIIEYKVVDKGGNTVFLNRRVVVGYTPIMSICLNEPSTDIFEVNKKFTISVYVFNNQNYDPDVKVNWYINGEFASSSIGLIQSFNLKESGEYEIYAQIDGTNVSSDVLKINVKDEIVINTSLIVTLIVVGISLVAILFGWTLVRKYKNRNFY